LRYEELQAQRWSRQKSFPCQIEYNGLVFELFVQKRKKLRFSKTREKRKNTMKKRRFAGNGSIFDQTKLKKMQANSPQIGVFLLSIFSFFPPFFLLKHPNKKEDNRRQEEELEIGDSSSL